MTDKVDVLISLIAFLNHQIIITKMNHRHPPQVSQKAKFTPKIKVESMNKATQNKTVLN